MKIIKFQKKPKNRYKVYFEESDITLSEDVILKYNLLLKKEITLEELETILKANEYYEAYNLSISYIEVKMRCEEEIRTYLQRKNYSEEIINDTITKLKQNKLLNEYAYIKAYINDKLNLSDYGPYKIRQNLIDLNFKEEDINEVLYKIGYEVWTDKLDRILDKKLRLSKNKSFYMKMNKLKLDLYNLGYDNDLVEQKINQIPYEVGPIDKDYQKALKKYDDKQKIIAFLQRKGYRYEEIKNLIKGEE